MFSRRACSSCPDTGSNCQLREGAGVGSRSGACSRIVWALVPPKPKALTPARLGKPSVFQSRSSALMKNGLFSSSSFGLARVKCRLGASCACSTDSTALMRPATPAAVSRWPMFGLVEPIAQNCVRSAPPLRKACVSAAISMGSPNCVPVPWASM